MTNIHLLSTWICGHGVEKVAVNWSGTHNMTTVANIDNLKLDKI